MSDEGNIQKNRQGRYSICFQNQQALQRSDIMKIFSRYGHVVYIGVTGDKTGYRFVHFATREEAERAVANVASHNIQLRSHKSKYTDDDNRHDISCRNNVTRVPVWQHEVDRFQNKELSTETPRERIFNVEYLRTCGLAEEDDDEEPPMPDLVGSNNQSVEENRKIVRNAAEIVVGNIPVGYGGAYFLHMFEKYVPIGIGHVIVAANTGMRYCHVYFRYQQDAEDVEETFDGCRLQDRKLIVMRPCTLSKANIMDN